MVYNPAWSAGKQKKAPRRAPSGGVKKSSILKTQGVGNYMPAASKREDVKTGFRSEVFKCKSFVQRYECLLAGNSTGIGVNAKGDRTIYVLRGSLYVTRAQKDAEGQIVDRQIDKVQEGNFIVLERGQLYELAAGGTMDVELMVTENPAYESQWESLEEGAHRASSGVQVIAGSSASPGRTRRPREETKAYQQALAKAGKANQVHPETNGASSGNYSNANSSAVVGVNPRPVIPTDD